MKNRVVDCPNCFSSQSEESDGGDNNVKKKVSKFEKIAKMFFGVSSKNITKLPFSETKFYVKKYDLERKQRVKKRDLIQRGMEGNKEVVLWFSYVLEVHHFDSCSQTGMDYSVNLANEILLRLEHHKITTQSSHTLFYYSTLLTNPNEHTTTHIFHSSVSPNDKLIIAKI